MRKMTKKETDQLQKIYDDSLESMKDLWQSAWTDNKDYSDVTILDAVVLKYNRQIGQIFGKETAEEAQEMFQSHEMSGPIDFLFENITEGLN